MGFALQSFPLESSIAPSSGTITQSNLRIFSPSTPRRQVSVAWIVEFYKPRGVSATQLIQLRQALIHSQVRSHSVLVLPGTEGRYSRERWMPFRGYNQNALMLPSSSHAVALLLKSVITFYFRVLRTPRLEFLKRNSPPYRLFTLFTSQSLR